MTSAAPMDSAPSVGADVAPQAEAVARANVALAAGCETNPALQGAVVQGLHSFKRDMAQSIRDTYAAVGQGGPTPGELAYHSLCAKAGIAPNDPAFTQAIAAMTGMLRAA